MFRGSLVGIFTAPASGEPMVDHASIVTARLVSGDRIAVGGRVIDVTVVPR
jgi:hypothetical protein